MLLAVIICDGIRRITAREDFVIGFLLPKAGLYNQAQQMHPYSRYTQLNQNGTKKEHKLKDGPI